MENLTLAVSCAVVGAVILVLAMGQWSWMEDLDLRTRRLYGAAGAVILLLGALANYFRSDGEPFSYLKLPPGVYEKLVEHGEFVLVRKEGEEVPLHVRREKQEIPEHFVWFNEKIHPILPPLPDPGLEAQKSNK